jgi:hypothetical protein
MKSRIVLAFYIMLAIQIVLTAVLYWLLGSIDYFNIKYDDLTNP